MVTRKGGERHRTRKTFKKPNRTRGKVPITRFLQEFSQGDRVCLQFEPSVAQGRYFHRFHGCPALVEGKRGACYHLTVKHKGTKRTLFVPAVHLKRLQ